MDTYPPDDPRNGMIPPGFGRGVQGMFGGLSRGFQGGANALNPYSNRLLAFGAGMLGGGPAGAAKGLILGSALDRESADRRKLNEAIQGLMGDEGGALSDLTPQEKAFLGAAGPETVGQVLGARLKPTDLSADMEGYQVARAQGYEGSYMDYQMDLKKAGRAETNVNTVSKFSDITTLRKDFENQPGVSRYRQSIPQIKSMASSINDTSKMSDYDFVYGLAQIFDPGSVVRESEQGFVLSGQSVPDTVRGQLATILAGGAGVSVEARRALVAAANRRVEQYRQQAESEAQYFEDLASRYEINPQDIVRGLEDMPELEAGGDDGFSAVPIP